MADCQVSPEAVRYDPAFSREVYALENGPQIKKCMQCGMCAVSCATRASMNYSPRRLFNLIKQGKKETVMKSNTMWMCTTCLMCKVRCPRGIAIVDVMHDLKNLAIDQGYVTHPQAAFYQAFWKEIWSRGRVFEGGVTARYFLKRGILGEIKTILSMKDVGMDMLRHSRMPLLPPRKIKGLGDLHKIIEKARSQRKEVS
ncbi:4Fe-4S dicluster domain-containing protein [Desulfotomaculum copahuensis]|uniref:Heterodisulfide reductase subunit C n=1 Tax=Desulfotomaculum copahuensis TaxID=1838280 RepID=A0A1B7LI16_9FIRM|nr:4Fe-4S dicluster domain-containing protein [Desulfotomaculum copahuensis]OAT85940.1 heterodisulfide reductase subunit C [Desulfotomaculum copahuensis]